MSQSLKIRIGGMHCSSCVSRVEQALKPLPGVKQVEIQLLDGSGRLVLEGAPDWNLLSEALKPGGYSIEPGSNTRPDAPAVPGASDWDSKLAPALITLLLGSVLMAAMHIVHGRAFYWLGLVVGTTVQLLWGRPFIQGTWRWIRGHGASMETLVGLGSTAALLLSVASPSHPYFEVAVFLVGFVRLGKFLESRARHRTGASVRALLSLSPPQALLLSGPAVSPTLRTVDASTLVAGDLIRILPGARIPADGIVGQGSSSVDESWLSGESLPVEKSAGMRVLAGSRNGLGTLEVTVSTPARMSLLAQIIERVERAQMSRPPIQRLADEVASRFVPAVLWASLLTAIGWLAFGATVSSVLLHAVSVLVIACPCALGLATPAALVVGLGRASRQGVLFKSGAALESLARARTFVFDKTGTLTQGKPTLESCLVLNSSRTEDQWLSVAASVETGSEHPLAQAFLRASAERSLRLDAPQKVQAVPGQGVRASLGGSFVLAGTQAFLQEQGIVLPPQAIAYIDEQASRGATCVALAAEFEPAAIFAFRDLPRPDARALVAELKELGAKVRLLSGDRRATALYVASELGIHKESVDAEVLPHQKEARVAILEESEGPVVMVGDGINDAPSLARASVSVSLLGASDAAIDAAQVMLMSGRISDLARAVEVARLTLRVIRQNLAASALYNVLGIPLAAGLFESSLGIGMSPALAGAAMALSSVSVVTNSLRLRA